MADASSVRAASSLPSATGRGASGLRFKDKELWLATGTNYVPVGRVIIPIVLAENSDHVDIAVFLADRAYEFVGVRESHALAGAASTSFTVKKAGAGTAVSAGTAITAAVPLDAVANTVQTPALAGTAADRLLAAGDKLGIDFGTTTTVAATTIQFILRPV